MTKWNLYTSDYFARSPSINMIATVIHHCHAIVCLFTFVCLVSSAHSRSQADTTMPTGTITGTVVNATTQAPVSGATIQVMGSTRGAVAGSGGRFVIRNVPAGIVNLRITAIGFEASIRTDVAVGPGKPSTVTVGMNPSDITLDTAVVTASALGDPQTMTSTGRLTSEEVRRAPGVQEDVVRAIALLPGVATTRAGRNDLAVRGGAPFENLFIVDNIEVPNINHFGAQGSSGGPLSIINIDFVRDVSLSTGGFGPKYGDRLSSVTNITLREGNDQRFGGEINLSATSFGVIGEGPIGDNGNYLFSIRRSYLDLIFTLAGFGFVPEYWDFTGKVSYSLDDRNSLSFLLIGALGSVRFNNESTDNRYSNSRVASPSQNQYFSGLTWKHLFGNGLLTMTLGRTFTAFRTRQQDTNATVVFRNASDEGEASLRADLLYLPTPAVELSIGTVSKYASNLSYDVLIPGYARLDASGSPQPLRKDTSFGAFRTSLYGQAAWSPTDRWKFVVGGRMDVYPYLDEKVVVAPRASASYSLTPSSTLAISGGRYYQSPQFIWFVGDPGNTALAPLRADQVVFSYQWRAREDLNIQVEGYYKRYGNYPGRIYRPQAVLSPSGYDDIYNDIPYGLEPISTTASGTTYGVELFIQKRLSVIPLYGLASISFNRTRFAGLDGTERPGAFDTPIFGTIAIGWRPDPVWELSSKLRASTGLPTTPYITTPDRATEMGFPVGALDFAFYNAGPRLPFFYALDIRMDRRWFFEGWQLITYIDVQNATSMRYVSGYRWNPRTNLVEEQRSIGILPSIGLNVEF